MIYLTNSLTKEKEVFKPIHEGKVGLYACGPTVYSVATIGNFRTFIFTDVLRRMFQLNGYEVKHVMNVTDVGHLTGDVDEGEDKMIVAMKREGKTAWEIAQYYTDIFLKDLHLLNILQPAQLPRATDHIAEQIEFIQLLEKKGFTYTIDDGVYFDTSRLADYGKLGGQKLEEKEAGARVAVNSQKKQASDFALWKFSPKDEKRDMEWPSPWGVGFPGWHIECSAMSEQYLDAPFDVHTGGIDLAPVHHENEIAQTSAAYENDLAHYWLHGAFLLIDGGKMSKSLGNAYTVDNLMEKGIDPLAYRYFTFTAHYRSALNFTWESIQAAQNALVHLRNMARDLDMPGAVDEESFAVFLQRVNDDLDMPGALAQVWAILKDEHLSSESKAATLLQCDRVLGLDLERYVGQQVEVPLMVQKMIEDREKARAKKEWSESDRLRNEIEAAGFVLEDGADGVKVRAIGG